MGLRQIDAERWELDGYQHSHGLFSAGCLLVGLCFPLTLAGLAEWPEGRLAYPFVAITLILFPVGAAILAAGLLIPEVFQFSGEGVSLRHGRRERWVARCHEIHSLALDPSERMPRRWRLVLVRQDGGVLPLTVHDPAWDSVSALGAGVATALAVPLRLPEGEERDRPLEVLPGDPPTVHYPRGL